MKNIFTALALLLCLLPIKGMAQDNRWFDVKLQPDRLLFNEYCLSVEKPIGKMFLLEVMQGWRPRKDSKFIENVGDNIGILGGILSPNPPTDFGNFTSNRSIISLKFYKGCKIPGKVIRMILPDAITKGYRYVGLNFMYKNMNAETATYGKWGLYTYSDNYHKYVRDLNLKFGYKNYFKLLCVEAYYGFGIRSVLKNEHLNGYIDDYLFEFHKEDYYSRQNTIYPSIYCGFKLGYHFKY